ncbi:MAG: DUF6884 domain-containing protein [Cellulosilyticaceae bacterium]
MRKIILILATNKRKEYPTIARNMYSDSHIFREAYGYACMASDEIYILSAKYGVLECEAAIESYEDTFDKQSIIERKKWTDKVLTQLGEKINLEQDLIEIIGDRNYCELLVRGIHNYKITLEGVKIEEQALYLKKQRIKGYSKLYSKEITQCNARDLHRILKGLKTYNYTNIEDIPFNNGLYIMVDKNEDFKGYNRIVRVGTHRGAGRLKGRLKQHFLTEDKNASILRKTIGSAMLNKYNDEYLRVWDVNIRNKKRYIQYQNGVDREKEYSVEKEVSSYLRENVSFYCIEEIDDNKRLEIKKNIIKCLYQDHEFRSSNKWLGKFSPVLHIATYGLWNNELKNE